ncbi:hypothetical protein KIN20_035836 [Parelaphostrongylus tenuis]|uniref:Uncharacterized protein n=1 Tax=Parelaphostrongylus tenuis TaxID=148309 RepID=A0AAD5RC74_PARTN|nr:hypothetical protein KIN20_035836 [Parelaphostrongylus tenuis]
MMESCIIGGSTVTGICPKMAAAVGAQQPPPAPGVGSTPVAMVATAIASKQLTISGTLTVRTVFSFAPLRFMKKQFYVDYKHHHG